MWNSGSTPKRDVVGRLERPVGVCLDLLEVGEQVAVGEHRGLRRAGGAAGEHQHGEVVGGAVDDSARVDAASRSSSADGAVEVVALG